MSLNIRLFFIFSQIFPQRKLKNLFYDGTILLDIITLTVYGGFIYEII